MSRVGKSPIKIKAGVKVQMTGEIIKVEGPKGKLSLKIPRGVDVKIEKDLIEISRRTEDSKELASFHGATRANLANMVHGVAEGFTRELDIVGVGYRAAVKGTVLSLSVGFSHPVDFKMPEGVSVRVDNNTHIVLNGPDKILLGMVAAKVRGVKAPEPYQGKGIRYMNEKIVRKEGKAAGAGAAGGK